MNTYINSKEYKITLKQEEEPEFSIDDRISNLISHMKYEKKLPPTPILVPELIQLPPTPTSTPTSELIKLPPVPTKPVPKLPQKPKLKWNTNFDKINENKLRLTDWPDLNYAKNIVTDKKIRYKPTNQIKLEQERVKKKYHCNESRNSFRFQGKWEPKSDNNSIVPSKSLNYNNK